MIRSTVDPNSARHIIQRMGETGQPPERGALAVNIGTDEYLDVLRGEYLVPMAASGRNSSFKLVQAPFGGGKTHFLHCLREVAWELRFATALVGVSPQECPFDDPLRIYKAVAREIELPPEHGDEERQPGLDIVLRRIAEEGAEKNGEDDYRAWIRDELGSSRIESAALRRAVMFYLEAVLDRDLDKEELLASYLRGEDVGKSELKPLQIRESPDDDNAFRFLRSVVQVLRVLQVPGVVLLFDELDRVMSLTVRRRRAIGDNLRQMIDYCGQSALPSLLWVYAVPPEFLSTVVPEYPALEQRLKGATRLSSVSRLAPIIDLDRLSLSPVQLFEQIGLRLLDLYERAYDKSFDRDIQDANVRKLAVELGENQLESGTRRTFVRAVVALLAAQHHEAERALSEAEAGKFAHRAPSSDFGDLPGEEEIL